MRTHAAFQLIGDRSHQCDATATYTHGNTRAYALLDGIGSSDDVRDWTRTAARRLARTAAHHADAEAGLRDIYEDYAADPDRRNPYAARYMPSAAAVVAVHTPGRSLTVAWCGDARAYLLPPRGALARLTDDHNLRRVYPPCDKHDGGNRNIITSYLGSAYTDEEVKNRYGHPAIETATHHMRGPCRLLLASDGAYEPHEDAGHILADHLAGSPSTAARGFVQTAVALTQAVPDPYADNATALIADLGTLDG